MAISKYLAFVNSLLGVILLNSTSISSSTNLLVTTLPSRIMTPCLIHAHNCDLLISTVAASSIKLFIGTAPFPLNHPLRYDNATNIFSVTPSIVTYPLTFILIRSDSDME
eukprot:NODE_231_length_13709_cov_0.444526.p11 type:complete len:110 gc:universal NODE_231_length_13709_cov_0.444526:1878-1549(-)